MTLKGCWGYDNAGEDELIRDALRQNRFDMVLPLVVVPIGFRVRRTHDEGPPGERHPLQLDDRRLGDLDPDAGRVAGTLRVGDDEAHLMIADR